jgi:hypothetical protein
MQSAAALADRFANSTEAACPLKTEGVFATAKNGAQGHKRGGRDEPKKPGAESSRVARSNLVASKSFSCS